MSNSRTTCYTIAIVFRRVANESFPTTPVVCTRYKSSIPCLFVTLRQRRWQSHRHQPAKSAPLPHLAEIRSELRLQQSELLTSFPKGDDLRLGVSADLQIAPPRLLSPTSYQIILASSPDHWTLSRSILNTDSASLHITSQAAPVNWFSAQHFELRDFFFCCCC